MERGPEGRPRADGVQGLGFVVRVTGGLREAVLRCVLKNHHPGESENGLEERPGRKQEGEPCQEVVTGGEPGRTVSVQSPGPAGSCNGNRTTVACAENREKSRWKIPKHLWKLTLRKVIKMSTSGRRESLLMKCK